MKIYLVGGAIRDRLLGRPIHENDWVVVQSSPEEMIAQGFIPVGKAFPVFLHPQTKEEYALARTERKVGPGYHGFTFHTAKEVSLKEDLARRDLTINALAEDDAGNIIDYYNGQNDLKQKVLRHITPAFSEDPVRVLRVARFAARYANLGFKVAPETLELMHQMGIHKELSYLVAERVWAEWEKALQEPTPGVFFRILEQAQVLELIFPHFRTPLLENALTQLDKMALIQPDATIRFALLMHYLLPAKTFNKELEEIVTQYKIPNHYYDMASSLQQALAYYLRINFKEPATIVDLYEAIDAHRRFARAIPLLQTCALIQPNSKQKHLEQAFQTLHTLKPIIPTELKGTAIADYIRQQRIAAVQNDNY